MPFRLRQSGFRFRPDDNVTLASTSWSVALNTSISRNVTTNFRVRCLVQEVGAVAGSCIHNLYYSLNSGAYADVTASTPVRFASSSQFTDGASITSAQLGGTGTWANGYGISSITTRTTSLVASGNTEVEFCLTIDSASVNNGDTIDLRVYNNTSAFYSYTQTARITVIKISPTRLRLSFSEFEVPLKATRAQISFSELEVPTYVAPTPTRAQISFTELEVPSKGTRALVSWAALETPFKATRFTNSWAALEVPNLPTRFRASFSELEVPFKSTRFRLSFSELEVPLRPAKAYISFAEFEVPSIGVSPTRGRISFTELEVPNKSTRALVSFTEFEVPLRQTRFRVSFAEFEIPPARTRGRISFTEVQVPDFVQTPTRLRVSYADFYIGDAPPPSVFWCGMTGKSGMTGGTRLENM